MKQKGIWLRKGLALYHLAPSELALALLVREKPLTTQQLSAALTEKAMATLKTLPNPEFLMALTQSLLSRKH